MDNRCTDTAASLTFQCWHLLLGVVVYIAHVQDIFYHIRTVVIHTTFGLLAVAASLESSVMPTAN